MSIGVRGQYLFKFGTTDINDFLKEEDLVSFTLIEESGNILPVFELIFNTLDVNVLKRLNEGNIISIGCSLNQQDRSKDILVTANYRITKARFSKAGKAKYRIGLVGIYDALSYTAVGRLRILKKKNSVEAIKEIVTPIFGTRSLDFNVDSAKDVQNWIQYSITDKSFVNNIWMHSNINTNTFMAIGISSDGKFILKDMRQAANPTGDEFRFVISRKTDKDIKYEGDYFVESNAGFLNHWMGYGRQKHVFNQELGIESDILEQPEVLLTMTGNLPRSADIEKRIGEPVSIGENVHANYWKSYAKNIQSLATFSNITLTLTFNNLFPPLRVLDLVGFSDVEINEQLTSAESHAGKYFISKIARTISERQLVTTVQLSRESISSQQGELR